MAKKLKTIYIIPGSTRPGRKSIGIARWVLETAQETSGGAGFEIVDLADYDLPLLDEPKSADLEEYLHEHTKRWSKKIAQADGFILVVPEYNHGYTAALKNALDYLYNEWDAKPVGFVSYGGVAAGTRAVQQLKQVVLTLGMRPLSRPAVAIPFVKKALDESGKPAEERYTETLRKLITAVTEAA